MNNTRTRPARPSSPVMKPRVMSPIVGSCIVALPIKIKDSHKVIDWMAGEIGLEIAAAYVRGQLGKGAMLDRPHYACARKIAKRLGNQCSLSDRRSDRSCVPHPVLVLDMSPAGQEWLVEEAAKAIHSRVGSHPKWSQCSKLGQLTYRQCARTVLAPLLSAQRKTKK